MAGGVRRVEDRPMQLQLFWEVNVSYIGVNEVPYRLLYTYNKGALTYIHTYSVYMRPMSRIF